MSPYYKIFFSAGIILLGLVTAVSAYARDFTVQVLSSSDASAAEKIKQALRDDGFDAYIEQHQGEAVIFRVRIGRFSSRHEAEQLQESLKLKGFNSWIAPSVNEDPGGKSQALPAQPDAIKNAAGENGKEPVEPKKPFLPESAESAPTTTTSASGNLLDAGPAEDKLYELVINPVPQFSTTTTSSAVTTAATTSAEMTSSVSLSTSTVTTSTSAPPCRPEKYFSYYDQRDGTLHVAVEPDLVPGSCKKGLRQVIVFPARFLQLDLHEMAARIELEGRQATLALDGIAPPQQRPSQQAVREFEALLGEYPLRVLYFPPRTDPDGTLHGTLLMKTGASVGQEMVRRGLAAQDGAQPPP